MKVIAWSYKIHVKLILSSLRNLMQQWQTTSSTCSKYAMIEHVTYVILWKDPGFFSANCIHFMTSICTMEYQIWQCFLHTGHLQISTPNPALHNGPFPRTSCMVIGEVSPSSITTTDFSDWQASPLYSEPTSAPIHIICPLHKDSARHCHRRARTWPVPLSSWCLLMQEKWPYIMIGN